MKCLFLFSILIFVCFGCLNEDNPGEEVEDEVTETNTDSTDPLNYSSSLNLQVHKTIFYSEVSDTFSSYTINGSPVFSEVAFSGGLKIIDVSSILWKNGDEPQVSFSWFVITNPNSGNWSSLTTFNIHIQSEGYSNLDLSDEALYSLIDKINLVYPTWNIQATD